MVYDWDKLIKSVLDFLIAGLEEEYQNNELIKKARFQLDQLSRLGMISLRIHNAFKGLERHKRFQKFKK